MAKLAEINLDLVQENPNSLRKVDKDTPEYSSLVDSIRNNGVLNPIVVVEQASTDEAGVTTIAYKVVDGLHRSTAARDAGLNVIPANIVAMDQATQLKAQIVGNAIRVETKPFEYSKHLVKILHVDPLLTLEELAKQLSKSKEWIESRLGLLDLSEEIGKMVDANQIGLSNAYVLSRLPADDQMEFLEGAQTMPPEQFTAQVKARLKDIRDAKAKGTEVAPQFAPVAHMRKRNEIEEALNDGKIVDALVVGLDSAAEGFAYAIKWFLHLDPASINSAKAKWEAEIAERNANREKRRIERVKAEEERAKKNAEKAREAAEKAAAKAKEKEDALVKLGGAAGGDVNAV